MQRETLLQGKKVLVVDDESDVLEVLTELLSICLIDRASTFDAAKKLLEKEHYDAVVLDIMGVKGFELLQISTKKGNPTLMLTAHALDKESLKRSAEEGASYYVPKEEIDKIDVFLADVIEAKEKNKNPWAKWVERLGVYFDGSKNFSGANWREENRKFWDEKLKNIRYV